MAPDPTAPTSADPTAADDDPLLLCCLLWAQPGRRPAMSAYEDRVLELLGDHGGVVLQRVVAQDFEDDDASAGPGQRGASTRPDEVQVYRFPGSGALERYLADPRRAALADERDAVVARTELFRVATA
ncbi:hypothetical protein [Cellulomonas sp. PhB143]|uniref:hypothetical protein n=1 Tax=Cellulomonas sp. PhB143 TaxID=2485186 RepID=UPI000F47281D|nr:hypothetical protein [Cellulomonas sp. PhB143]ROS78655.1 hypothetical protein EDF32_0555 [Cellulomonas sp. PhB143]